MPDIFCGSSALPGVCLSGGFVIIERSINETFSGGMKSFVDVFADGIALLLEGKKNYNGQRDDQTY